MANDLAYNPGYSPASVLVEATGDVMDNIWDLQVIWPWSSGDTSEAAPSYRCSGFNPPNSKTPTYDIYWHGIKVKKVASGITLERQFDLNFRLDANYALFNKFITWKKITGDVNTGGVANTASALGQLKLIAPGAEYNSQSWALPDQGNPEGWMLSNSLGSSSKLVWTFKDVQCVEVEQPKFNNTSETGKSQNYKVTFIFGDVYYPFYDIYTKS